MELISLFTTGGKSWWEQFVISDTKNEWCYAVTVNMRCKMFMIPWGQISKHSSNLNCRRLSISQRDAFSIYMRCRVGEKNVGYTEQKPVLDIWSQCVHIRCGAGTRARDP